MPSNRARRRLATSIGVLFTSFLSLSASETSTATKTVCLSCFGMNWQTSEEARTHLVTTAKHELAGQLFGELIRSITEVDNFILTKHSITAYSVGFIRIDGSAEFFNGIGVGDICVKLNATVSDEDLERFRPREVRKKICIADPRLSLGEVRRTAETQARVQAVRDFEPTLESVQDGVVLGLIHQSRTDAGGFIPDTETYCVTVMGVVYPVELMVATGGNNESNPTVRSDDFLGKNLLVNPGAEEGLRGWVTNTSVYTTRSSEPSPHEGTSYFYPSAYKGVAVAAQTVTLKFVAGGKPLMYTIRAYMRDFEGSKGYRDDTSQVVLSFLSATGGTITSVKSKEVAISSHWVKYEHTDVIPRGAVAAKIELVSRYVHGAQNNDGYFDDIYFGVSK